MKRIVYTFLMGLVLLCALWFRFPRIGAGLPYFYNEDEAHHYDRIVNMVKNGEYNPNYFHKPSLHFYLRMPVVALSFLWEVRQGYIRSVREINTQDPFGIAGYAFSASHPGIVKWNRAFSVLLSLLSIVFTYLIVQQLSESKAAACAAALLAACSPSLIADSGVIGVDVLMTCMCLAAIYASLRLYSHFSLSLLTLTGLTCGLAVSSKYNALPIIVLPLIVCLLRSRHSFSALSLALLTPLLGFFIGTPFAIISLPQFLDQFAYEIWHYGIAGHEGHTAQPGWPQAMFYLSWLNREALGPVATAFGIIGLPLLFLRDWKRRLIFLTFPILFALLMIDQRANFTRNLLVLIPLISVVAVLVVDTLLSILQLKRKYQAGVFILFSLLAVAFPARLALEDRALAQEQTDSRSLLSAWLTGTGAAPNSDSAIAGQLQLPKTIFQNPGLVRIDQKEWSPTRLYLAGFDRLVSAPGYAPDTNSSGILKLEHSFSGVTEAQRIMNNPQINVYRFVPNENVTEKLLGLVSGRKEFQLDFNLNSTSGPACLYGNGTPPPAGEAYCWTTARIVFVRLTGIEKLSPKTDANGMVKLNLILDNPWPNQALTFALPGWSYEAELPNGNNQTLSIWLPWNMLKENQGLFLSTQRVLSPQSQGLSADERRLGVALRNITF